MIRMLVPWTTVPRLVADWEWDFPGLMNRFVEEEPFENGMKFIPEANVVETDKAFEVTMELPGMKPEEVKLVFHDGRLCVSGAKQEEKEEKGKKFHRVERRSGSFRRVIAMPSAIDEAAVEATFAEGVLKVTMPKSREALAKSIPVKAPLNG